MNKNAGKEVVTSFSLAFFIGIVASFSFYSLQWNNESRDVETFSSPESSTVFNISSPGREYETERLYADINDILTDGFFGLVIDGQGDGIPGLLILDPNGTIPWIPTVSEIRTQKDYTQAYIFTNTFCYKMLTQTGSCELTPTPAKILGTIDPVPGADYLQYAAVPSTSMTLGSARIIASTHDSAALAELGEIFEKYGFEVYPTARDPYWLELATNPLIVISFGLFFSGLIFSGIYWHLRADTERTRRFIRLAVGATPRRLLIDSVSREAKIFLPAILSSSFLIGPLVTHLTGVPLAGQVARSSFVAAFVSFSLITVVFACATGLGLRSVGRRTL